MSQNKQNKHCVLIVITAAACIIAEIWATLCMLHVFLAYPLSVKVISNYSSLSSAFLIFPVLFSIVKHYFQFMNCKFKIILRKWVILKQYYICIFIFQKLVSMSCIELKEDIMSTVNVFLFCRCTVSFKFSLLILWSLTFNLIGKLW